MTLAAGPGRRDRHGGAEAFHRRLGRALARGWIVTVDYGHPARVLYHPFARPAGTLAVHAGGRRGGDPLEAPGSQDLTAHVNWDALLAAGESEGLRVERLVRQGIYLTESGVFDFAANDAEKWRVYRLVDPGGMGEEISVLFSRRASTRRDEDDLTVLRSLQLTAYSFQPGTSLTLGCEL